MVGVEMAEGNSSVRNRKMLDMVLQNKSDSDTYLRSSDYYSEWKMWHDMSESIPSVKPYEWMSNKFMPMTFSKLETAVASYMGMLFGANPPIQVKPMEQGDVENAKVMQKLLGYQYEQSQIYLRYMMFVRGILTYGTGIAKIVMDYKEENNIVWQPQFKQFVNPQGKVVGQDFTGVKPERSVKETRMPSMINCNIEDIFPDPMAIDIQDSWIIHRTRRTLNYLRRMHQLHPEDYNAEVMKIQESDTGDRQFEDKEDLYSSMGRFTNAGTTRPKNTGYAELYERWGLYDLGNKDDKVLFSGSASTGKMSIGLEHAQITVAAGKYLIQARPNPYWHKRNPFIKGVYVPRINSFYGKGIPEILEDLQNNVNEMVNQRNDNISLALNTPFEYDRTAGIDLENLMMKPGGLYGSDGAVGTALRPIPLEFYTKDVFIHVQDMERWADAATAITPPAQGLSEAGSQTATEASIKARGSSSRISMYAKINEKMAFGELARFFYQYNYQHMTEEEVIAIVGVDIVPGKGKTEWITVTPEILRKDYDFKPAGVFTMESKQQTALRVIQFLNIAGDDPVVKKTEAYRIIYSALELGDNSDELIRNDAEVQEITNLARQMAIQMIDQKIGKTKSGGGGSGTFVADESVPTPNVPLGG